MSDIASSTRPDTLFGELLGLLAGDASESALARRLLEEARQDSGSAGAALYLKGDRGFVREVVAGEDGFPAFLGADGGAADGSVHPSVELPGALLLLGRPRAAASLRDELLVLLGAATRLLALRRRLKQQDFERNYRGVELEALYDVGLAIARTLNLDELGEEILLRAVMLLDARRGALYLLEAGEYRLDTTFGGSARPSVALGDPTVEALLRGEAPRGGDLLPGATHLLAVPIEIEEQRRGLLVVADKESRRGVGPFRPADRRTLALFGNQAAIALENAHLHRQALEKERLEREMQLAADIQRRLLPTLVPEVEGFELLGWSRPAQEVGGDYYDLISLPGQRIGMVVGDVSGKGIPAALMVSTLHSALRLLLDRVGAGPDLMQRLNRHILATSTPNKFITFLFAELEPADHSIQYLNAGHNPPIVVGCDGSCRELPPGGLPLGVLAGALYAAQTFELAPGELLCLYSDGVTECFSPEDEEFGAGRLQGVLCEHRDRALGDIVEAVDRATTGFAQGRPQADDQTLVLLRRAPC